MTDEKTRFDKIMFWEVLIVDDDKFIHRMLKEVIGDMEFEGKKIKIHSAYTTMEAIKILKDNRNIALILLDIFLENHDSGLELVKYIREDIKNIEVRIILITGKNSKDLEEVIISNYDINGYKNKSDLFSQKMKTVILSTLRGYRDISLLKNNRQVMEKVVECISNLYKVDSIEEFLSQTIYHLNSVIHQIRLKDERKVNYFGAIKQENTNIYIITEGNGKFKDSINQKVRETLLSSELIKVKKTINGGEYEIYDDCYISRYKSSSGNDVIIYIEVDNNMDKVDRELLDLCHKSITSTFENLCLNLEIEQTQKELLYTLGEVTEARAEETGFHVKRVSKYCEVLGREYRLSPRDMMLLTNAAPIHDIGKVAIPDNILLKPGKLSPEEFEIMKSHTTVGYNLLKNSNRQVLKTAVIVAHEHHERYDGTGYPRGLKGEEIHIYGRISAIADVFDALGSPRIYKKAWVINDILKYFKEEKGKHFDPKLVDILFDNLDEILAIREKYGETVEGAFSRKNQKL